MSRTPQVSFARRLGRLLLIAAIAAASVAGVHALDAKRQRANQTALALRWARQMVTQSESLALAADAHGEREPLGWAARLLSQGTDSRIIFASPVRVTLPVAERDLETYSLDQQTGIFDYTKILDPQAGEGIRIRLYTARTGIFGAKTVLQHDLTVTALFMLVYGLLYFWFVRRAPATGTNPAESDSGSTPPTPASAELLALKPLIAGWVGEASQALTQLGAHIREMVRAATQLASASRESKNLLTSLHLKLHVQLEHLHEKSRAGSELNKLAAEVEKLFTQKPNLDPAAQQLLKKLLASAIRQAEAVQEIEIQLEPVASDADMAIESLKAMSEATRAIGAEIQATTQGMVEQSRRMGDLKKRGAS